MDGVCSVVLDPEKGIIFLFGSSENSLTTHFPARCERRHQSFGATPAANTRTKSRTVGLGEERGLCLQTQAGCELSSTSVKICSLWGREFPNHQWDVVLPVTRVAFCFSLINGFNLSCDLWSLRWGPEYNYSAQEKWIHGGVKTLGRGQGSWVSGHSSFRAATHILSALPILKDFPGSMHWLVHVGPA